MGDGTESKIDDVGIGWFALCPWSRTILSVSLDGNVCFLRKYKTLVIGKTGRVSVTRIFIWQFFSWNPTDWLMGLFVSPNLTQTEIVSEKNIAYFYSTECTKLSVRFNYIVVECTNNCVTIRQGWQWCAGAVRNAPGCSKWADTATPTYLLSAFWNTRRQPRNNETRLDNEPTRPRCTQLQVTVQLNCACFTNNVVVVVGGFFKQVFIEWSNFLLCSCQEKVYILWELR